MTIIEAVEILETKLAGNSFASSLVGQFRKKGNLSPKQEFWALKLASEAGLPPKVVEGVDFDFRSLVELFEKGAAALKFPKMTISDPESGVTVQLSRAGSRSNFPGAINVKVAGEDAWGHSEWQWVTRILTDGKVQQTKALKDEILALLKAFSADPAGIAADHGKRTGNCTFCSRPLSDNRSVSVGYGPICAERYALPWG